MLISSEEEFLHDIFIIDNDNQIYQSKKECNKSNINIVIN